MPGLEVPGVRFSIASEFLNTRYTSRLISSPIGMSHSLFNLIHFYCFFYKFDRVIGTLERN